MEHLTSFSQLIGHEQIKKQLTAIVAKRRIGHAFLFTGPEGVGKCSCALALAAHLMRECGSSQDFERKIARGIHPDVHLHRPEGKLGLHSIESMRKLCEQVFLPPFESTWKVFIIDDAERMLATSANALLKTFEEPPAQTLIILISQSPSSLLPTILSRCSVFYFERLQESDVRSFLMKKESLTEELQATIAKQAHGSIGKAEQLVLYGSKAQRSLLQLLTSRESSDYRSFQQAVQLICKDVEAAQKQREEAAGEFLCQMPMDQMSAFTQGMVEKEVEGLLSKRLLHEASHLFETVASWYRDLELLRLGGTRERLLNPDYEEALNDSLQRGEVKPLEEVIQAIQSATLSLQRSTALAICLENLLLKVWLK